ncbi:hypothetical protein 20Sep418_00049 [Pseudomonas phage 20Sep418]|uniref:Uncharacterized protein n=5 Tax=Pakpunavirus TaxID=1921407 RepID=A0AAE9KDY8_9CAUD|nr:hypothetical protein QE325_gp191 [Pseudomonas phage pPA-3099-2aT.2]YP_010765286.1 hypothetical protein QE347_gp178 [Pseudomonas phage vB_Paer_Ps12]YP_010765482.1 hypothetical protein QE348_gp186 [Pseudomonas phage vB_Paer_PsIn]YP_010765682.1 hypothetical protein QE349_gp189 [Pseudomonas phage vB_Paer_PsCh]UOL47821.1 hypothetical protein vBPaerPs25_177c [Pseudomonas phage vB_Paer_Ps25]WFG37210.1 hypothetical protein 9081_00109 [Pseudomonas phage bmx-p3]WFG37724.1 hypothetical protein 20Sep4
MSAFRHISPTLNIDNTTDFLYVKPLPEQNGLTFLRNVVLL